MRTTTEVFLDYNCHGFECKCGCQDGPRTRQAMRVYAREAIKVDRENVAKHVRLTEFAQEFLQEGASKAIDKNSILNAPNIELL